jgi:hypothetical protein
MRNFEITDDKDLAELLKISVQDGLLSESDIVRVSHRILGGGHVNVYPSNKAGRCSDRVLIMADLKVHKKKFSFDEAIDALIEHCFAQCSDSVREVVFIAFGEFILKKYERFAGSLAHIRQRGVQVHFYQWSRDRLLKLPY